MKRALVFLSLLAVVLWWKSRPPEVTVISGRAMGCDWTLAHRGPAPSKLHAEVAAVLEHWEQVLSTWRPDSDLSKHAAGAPATTGLSEVLELAEKFRRETGGSFDHRIDGLDLSAIGKGFTIDRVAGRVRELGVQDFVFELGGELITGTAAWDVGIQNPAGAAPTRRLLPPHTALATSGNIHQPTHIIDPRNRRPVVRPPSLVTVTASDAATADAWATALFVLGPEVSPQGAPEFTWQTR